MQILKIFLQLCSIWIFEVVQIKYHEATNMLQNINIRALLVDASKVLFLAIALAGFVFQIHANADVFLQPDAAWINLARGGLPCLVYLAYEIVYEWD